jgi:hypothetical protein
LVWVNWPICTSPRGSQVRVMSCKSKTQDCTWCLLKFLYSLLGSYGQTGAEELHDGIKRGFLHATLLNQMFDTVLWLCTDNHWLYCNSRKSSFKIYSRLRRRVVAQSVETLCYKPEGRRLDSQQDNSILQLTQSFQPQCCLEGRYSRSEMRSTTSLPSVSLGVSQSHGPPPPVTMIVLFIFITQ